MLDRTHTTKAFVLCPKIKQKTTFLERSKEARLDEAVGLARAISLEIVGQHLIQLEKVSPATYIGSGAVEELKGLFKTLNVDLVIMDAALSPVQQRNLEKKWQTKVIDRTGLILEIFGERARTAEGSLQVELAALQYQRSRLVRSWTHLERQRGGFGFTGGPGESQLELDRRIIDDRIFKIKHDLEKTVRTRRLQRSARERVPYPIVALVGYTNAGKSTLFNTLTKSDVFAKDLLFATLDPTMRQIKLPSGQQVILSDTVGFISDLPTTLIAAFRATLEEVTSADLILHVRDISHDDTEHQKKDVEEVLKELGLEQAFNDGSVVDVWNKMDILSPEAQDVYTNKIARNTDTIGISALTGEGLDALKQLIGHKLAVHRKVIDVTLPASAGELLAWCYRQGAIFERIDEDDHIHLKLRLPPSLVPKFWERYRKMIK
ncbi:MAG: GTPase HflX [Alphaproteobacteria bacterium]|nr:GTPase HflX [Alphaproteobacteria bacterium]